MDIFESLENLNVSEECFDDILNIVEEYISETKKANKIAHQEAIFKGLNPHGVEVMIDQWQKRDINRNPERKEAKKRLTDVTKLDSYFGEITKGKTHSMQDLRKLENTDRKESAPKYASRTPGNEWNNNPDMSPQARIVRDALGRGGKFSKESPEPSKSNKMAKLYMDIKRAKENYRKKNN